MVGAMSLRERFSKDFPIKRGSEPPGTVVYHRYLYSLVKRLNLKLVDYKLKSKTLSGVKWDGRG